MSPENEDVFKRSLDALLGQAELIFTRLEAAVSGNLTYRAS